MLVLSDTSRKLGKGIPSAAPDGFFDGPPDWSRSKHVDSAVFVARSVGDGKLVRSGILFRTGAGSRTQSRSMIAKRIRMDTTDANSQG